MTTHRMPIDPEQAQMWLSNSGVSIDIEEVNRWTLLVLNATIPPGPPIVIKDGAVSDQNGANKLAAIASTVAIRGFPPTELDVKFVTSLPDVKETEWSA